MQLSEAYQNSPAGRRNATALAQPYDKALHKKEALVHEKRALSGPTIATYVSPLSSCIAFTLCHVGSHSATLETPTSPNPHPPQTVFPLVLPLNTGNSDTYSSHIVWCLWW